MSLLNVDRTMNVRGFLAKGPFTDFLIDFPHGGTPLGLLGRIMWRVIPTRGELTAQEYGGKTFDFIENGYNVVIAAILREYDSDAIETIFPGVTAGSATASGFAAIDHTALTQRGALASARAVPLIFSPQNTEQHPAIYLERAIPLLEENLVVNESLETEWGVSVMFQGIPTDAVGLRMFQHKMLEDLTI